MSRVQPRAPSRTRPRPVRARSRGGRGWRQRLSRPSGWSWASWDARPWSGSGSRLACPRWSGVVASVRWSSRSVTRSRLAQGGCRSVRSWRVAESLPPPAPQPVSPRTRLSMSPARSHAVVARRPGMPGSPPGPQGTGSAATASKTSASTTTSGSARASGGARPACDAGHWPMVRPVSPEAGENAVCHRAHFCERQADLFCGMGHERLIIVVRSTGVGCGSMRRHESAPGRGSRQGPDVLLIRHDSLDSLRAAAQQ